MSIQCRLHIMWWKTFQLWCCMSVFIAIAYMSMALIINYLINPQSSHRKRKQKIYTIQNDILLRDIWWLKLLSKIKCHHRYLRNVDCTTNISLWNIHFSKRRAPVLGTKQRRQAWSSLGSPNCPVSLPTLSAHLPCWPACFFVPTMSACFPECIFVAATNSTNQTNKAGSMCH